MADLHIETYGTGEPAVFVHGSGSWGAETFGAQRVLADEFQVILIDRCGYGQSPADGPIGWPTDTGVVADLLTGLGRAHLVGHSTGGTVALLAAAEVPHAVHSLTLIEPTVWGIADPVDSPPECAAADKDIWRRGPDMSAEEFLTALSELAGVPGAAEMVATWTTSFTEADWTGANAQRNEAWPGDARIDLAALAASRFPKLVAVGAWDPAVHPEQAELAAARQRQALGAEHHALAGRINASLVTFGRSMHNPMVEEPDKFNALLRDTWRQAQPG
jgi:pimeloyl-ACP methyl ester carboxylesterase